MVKLEGKIKKVFPSETFSNFEKRIFWLEEVAAEARFQNTWQLELWKADCPMIDKYKVGDYITAYVDIKGRSYPKRDGSGEAVMNTIKCWNIEKDGVSVKQITG